MLMPTEAIHNCHIMQHLLNFVCVIIQMLPGHLKVHKTVFMKLMVFWDVDRRLLNALGTRVFYSGNFFTQPDYAYKHTMLSHYAKTLHTVSFTVQIYFWTNENS
jgi:hypothetical protein